MKSITKLLLVLSTFIITSCMHSKLRYIQDKNEVFGRVDEYNNKAPDYKLMPKDILYVKISSTNAKISSLFDIQSNGVATTSSSSNGSSGSFYLQGFTISDSGYVEIPVLGKIAVAGLTVDETQTLIQKETDAKINNAIVSVKLVSFYIEFLGEIARQGRLNVMQDDINILDALSQMGGITDYGDRENVLIVRQTKIGTKTFRVDLTKRELLSSKEFYMLPYDMVVVEPLRRKSFQLNVRDYSLVLTTITSTITMILLIANLKK